MISANANMKKSIRTWMTSALRGTAALVVIDPATRRINARIKLGGSPDYVRWVAPVREVWVSEPGSKRIETFRLAEKSPPRLVPAGNIEVADGPESLEIDPPRNRVYSNTWHDKTIAIDLGSRAIGSSIGSVAAKMRPESPIARARASSRSASSVRPHCAITCAC